MIQQIGHVIFFQQKPYIKIISVSDARLRFKIESKMVPSVKMNFQSETKFKNDLWSCRDCGKIDSQIHITHCSTYEEYRSDLDLTCDKDIVTYFRRVLEHRMKSV